MTVRSAPGNTGMLARLHGRLHSGFNADDPAFIEQVLRLRAKRLASVRTAVAATSVQGIPALCFSIGREVFALALSDMSEVMPLGAWTPVPGMAQQLLGVTNVRGEIRPLLNLHAMLALPEPEAGMAAYVVYLRRNGREVGLRVDGLDRIRFIDMGLLTVPHETANGLPQRFIAGISPDTLILLDARQILALDVLQDHRADYRRAI